MKFIQALEKRKTVEEPFTIIDEICHVRVVPENGGDRNRYYSDFNDKFTDEQAKRYSEDGEFVVCAFFNSQGYITTEEILFT